MRFWIINVVLVLIRLSPRDEGAVMTNVIAKTQVR